MTYDLAVWRPAPEYAGQDASDEFDERMRLYTTRLAAGTLRPACRELQAFCKRIADLARGAGIFLWEGPEDGNLTREADGDFLYVNLTGPYDEEVIEAFLSAAEEASLVVYDPQLEAVV